MAQVSKYCKQMSCFAGFVNAHLKINACIDLAYHCISVSSYKYNFGSENMSILEVSSWNPWLRVAPALILYKGKKIGHPNLFSLISNASVTLLRIW